MHIEARKEQTVVVAVKVCDDRRPVKDRRFRCENLRLGARLFRVSSTVLPPSPTPTRTHPNLSSLMVSSEDIAEEIRGSLPGTEEIIVQYLSGYLLDLDDANWTPPGHLAWI